MKVTCDGEKTTQNWNRTASFRNLKDRSERRESSKPTKRKKENALKVPMKWKEIKHIHKIKEVLRGETQSRITKICEPARRVGTGGVGHQNETGIIGDTK